MSRPGKSRSNYTEYIILGIILVLAAIYFGIITAPVAEGNFLSIISNLDNVKYSPFQWTPWTLRVIGVYLLIVFFAAVFYMSAIRNTRYKEEEGSAEWGDPRVINKKYTKGSKTETTLVPNTDIPIEHFPTKIMTRNVSIDYNTRAHRRNMNTLVCGGSGAGKTRFYAKPNLLQGNTSYVVLDPKGEILRDTGYAMKSMGYKVKVLDLINMERSDRYNPFVYVRNDNDLMKLVTNLFKATGGKEGQGSSDPFWDEAAKALLTALCAYLYYEAPKDEQNFAMVSEMLRAGALTGNERNGPEKTPLDYLFEELPDDHIAKKYYRDYHAGGAKTLQSIQITLSARLKTFNLDSLKDLTRFDMLNLKNLGEERTVLYALIPDNDTTFNFMVSILYTQLFQELFYSADFEHNGRLPVHVHFLMDEFANVALPDDFDKILAVMRSREISVSIIIQNMAQLKALFEKQHESIVGNCDEFLYLGGNEKETHKYVSELLGKETLDTRTSSRSFGAHGNSSTQDGIKGRDLMTPDEVRLLDNKYAILFIRGERPILDLKYEITEHPNAKYSADALVADPRIHGKENYLHGQKKVDFEAKRAQMVDLYSNSIEDMGHIEGYTADELYNYNVAVSTN